MQLKPSILAALTLACSGLAFSAQAQTQGATANTSSAGSTSQALSDDQIDARYDAAMDRCDGMTGNDEDVCKQKAKAERDDAKAEAKRDKEVAKANRKAKEDKQDANYELAKEKCDAMSGDQKDACIEKAKAEYNQ